MINFSNFRDHPAVYNIKVFQFNNKERADYFESLLKKDGVWFERGDEEDEGKEIYYFAVRKNDFKKANHLNYLVSARYRKPFMPNLAFRALVLVLTLVAIALAIAGAVLSD